MSNTMSPKLRWKKILLIQLVLWPVLLVIVDLVMRVATGYDGEHTRIEIAEIVESMNTGVPEPGRNAGIDDMQVGDLGLHPYTGFAQRYLVASHSSEFAKARTDQPENEYRILLLGGSVAGGFGNLASAGIRELQRMLLRDPRFEGRTIRFIPQGHGSFKQPQQLNLANFLFGSGVLPHAVINLDGFNEVALNLENSYSGMHPSYPSFSQWVHLSTVWGTDTRTMLDALIAIRAAEDKGTELGSTAIKWGLHHSSLLGPRVLKRMRGAQREHSIASEAYVKLLMRGPGLGPLSGPQFEQGEAAVLEAAVRMWSESSRSLHALCEDRGVYYLGVLQPTLHDEGSKVPTEGELKNGVASKAWLRGAQIGYPLLREAGARLLEQGVHFLDASRAFLKIPAELYYDPCHFNQQGNAILGRFIASGFLKLLPLGELPR